MKKVRHKFKRALSTALTVVLAAGACTSGFLPGSIQEVEAMQRPGTAPYINTWLVAGPSDYSVTDEIYSGAMDAEDGNGGDILTKSATDISGGDVSGNAMVLSADGVPEGNVSSGDGSTNPAADLSGVSNDNNVQKVTEKLIFGTCAASTVLNGDEEGYGADKAVDGDPDTKWASNTKQGVVWDDNLALTCELGEPSTVSGLKVILFEKDGKKLDASYQLIHKSGIVLKTGRMENLTPGEKYEIELGKPVANVSKIVFVPCERGESENKRPNHLGFAEVEAWGIAGETGDGEPETLGNISPVLGETFGEARWQYFDDRIFNRNTDDYQDLYGYFTVKQGQEIEGKYVYAHTYVYSDKDQEAQLRFVTTGLHKVYVNDIMVDQNGKAVESSNKDQYIRNINLKKGWNKVLIEIEQDRVMYLGFYARITSPVNGSGTNSAGDVLEGITCSVTGPHTQDNTLEVVTQGLDIDKNAFEQRKEQSGIVANQYPENEMPNGYEDWPYVWNKALYKTDAQFAPQASRFQFEAAGGVPQYSWSIVEGSLPDGLTLSEDGQIDGFCKKKGEYTFTVQVTDAEDGIAQKEHTIIVKERPNKWFEEGKMSALSHHTGGYSQFFDPNFSYDLWAERAKEAGVTMLSTEALQMIYYWPAPGSFPGDPTGAAAKQHPNTLEEIDGKLYPQDVLAQTKEAADRHGLRFGLYYAGPSKIFDSRVECSNGFFMNVEDLMKRYDPYYFFFDGNPQKDGRNMDAMWSSIRAYNDYALIQSNDQNETGDNDITILESEYIGDMPYNRGGYWETNMLNQNKYTVEESWCHPFFKEVDGWSQYAGGHMRDDWRLWAEFIVNNIGHGIVPNYDQMIISNRGVDWNGYGFNAGIKDVYYNYPLNVQKFIDLRENVNAWIANEGKPDLHESLFGTMPYYFDTYEKQSGWHENTEKEPFLTAKYGEGPEWGYTVGRDQFVYMHMIENTIGNGRAKKGFTGQNSIYAGPFDYDVTDVEWLNEGKKLSYTTSEKDGRKYITIDTSSVTADPVDTIIKITTDNPVREFQLTGVKLFSSQNRPEELQLRAEAYLKTFTSVFADAELVYTSEDPGVAAVDVNGLVTPVSAGKTIIHVTASYEGAVASDSYHVQVKADGSIAPAEELDSVVLRTDGKEAYGLFSTNRSLPVTLEGRTEKGGGINILSCDDVTWHYGICSGQTDGQPAEADGYWHAREVESNDVLEVVDQEVMFKEVVTEEQNLAIWADVTIDGQKYTTNINYLRIRPETVISNGAEVTATSGEYAGNLTDGIINSADGGNTSKWTPDKEDKDPAVTLELNSVCEVGSVTAYFNNKDRYYRNTPAGIQIETSVDGQEWSLAAAGGAVPDRNTKYVYEDNRYTYTVNHKAQYVRVTFPGGAKDEILDVLEIQVNGIDVSNILYDLVIEPKQLDDTTAELLLAGYSGDGSMMNLSGAQIHVTSDNEEIISINEKSQLTAVALGRAKITVEVTLNGSKIVRSIYANVDETGKLYFGEYLKEVKLSLDQKAVAVDDPAAAVVEALLNTGSPADLSGAEVEYIFSENAPVVKLENADIIYMQNEIPVNEDVTVQVKVTIDGITVESNKVQFCAQGTNIASGAQVEVSSVRDRNGDPYGSNQDTRYLGSKAVDGDLSTVWAARRGDISPWIRLDFGEEKAVNKVVLIDRGNDYDTIGEGRLQFFDAQGEEVKSMMVTDIEWKGQPENVVELDEAVAAASVKFTIDPEEKYHKANAERGLTEIRVFCEKKTANKIEAFRPVYVQTEAGILPGMPEKVTAIYSDITDVEVKVTWDQVTQDMVASPGVVMVEGTVDGTDVKARAAVKVVAGSGETVDKSLLQKTYDYALTLSTQGVVDSARKFFEEACSEAKAVLDNPGALRAQVDAAWDKLLKGIWGLGLYQGDKTTLEILVNKAVEMLCDEDKYVHRSWQQLTEALEVAQAVMKDGDAMEEDIKPAAESLLKAILTQRYKARKDILQDMINKANAVDQTLFIEESIQLMCSALGWANKVMADENLSEEDQPIVDKATEELNQTILNLVKKEDSNPLDPTNPTKSTDSFKNTDDGQKDILASPKTGDNSPFTILIFMATLGVVSIAGAVFYKRKKR